MISIPLFFTLDLFKQGIPIAKKIFLILLFMCNLYFVAAFIHFALYFYLIPQNHTEIRLSTQNRQEFQASILNLASPSTPELCNKNLDSLLTLDSDLNLTQKAFCELSLKTSLDELFLGKETYTVKLYLKYHLFSSAAKAPQEISLALYLVNQQLEIYKINRSLLLGEKEARLGFFSYISQELQEWVDYLTRKEYETISEFMIINRIPNQIFNLQALFIDLPKIDGIIYESSLIFDVNLKGLRYYMSEWFWTSALVMINFYAIVLACGFFMVKMALILILGLYKEIAGKITNTGELFN